MSSDVKALYKIQLKYLFTSKNIVLAVLFALFTYANFFIRHHFFTESYASLSLFFSAVPYISIIIIPSLTAKSSVNSYDVFIPYSSGVKLATRFFTLLTLYSCFLVLLLPAVLFISFFLQIEAFSVILSFFFLILYAACTISLCLLIFELVSNQITAFVISSILLAIFNNSHNFTVYFSSKNIFILFFKQISFAWHFDAASKAIFDSRDFAFFVIFTLLFLALTHIVSEKKKGRFLTQSFRLFLYTVFLLLVFLNSNRYYFRLDCSRQKAYSPSNYSKALLQNVEEPLFITFYRSQTLTNLYPEVRDVTYYLQSYASYSKNISFKIINPDADEKAQKLLDSYGIKAQEIKSTGSTSTNITKVYSSVVLEYNGLFEAVPFVLGAKSLEYDLDIRVKRLISKKDFTVNVILGNSMTFTNDYTYLVPIFNLQGFKVNPLFLNSNDFSGQLASTSGPLFVIGDSEIKIDAAIAIESYIMSGKGNAFFAVSPYSVNINGDWSLSVNKNTNIVELLENLGIRFENKLAGDVSCARITMVSGEGEDTFVLNYPLWVRLVPLPQNNLPSSLTLFWPTVLSITDERLAKPYLFSSPQGFALKADELSTNPFETSSMQVGISERKPLILGAEISGSLSGLYTTSSTENAKIIVVSDQYFLNTLMNNYSTDGNSADFSNFDFAIHSALYLMNESELCKLFEKVCQPDTTRKLQNDEQTIQKFQRLALFASLTLFLLIPAIIVIFYVAASALHKKKLCDYCNKILKE